MRMRHWYALSLVPVLGIGRRVVKKREIIYSSHFVLGLLNALSHYLSAYHLNIFIIDYFIFSLVIICMKFCIRKTRHTHFSKIHNCLNLLNIYIYIFAVIL